LQDVLGVDDGADHASAIAVQFRPQRSEYAIDVFAVGKRWVLIAHCRGGLPASLRPFVCEHVLIAN
jgi:hypothetical protein